MFFLGFLSNSGCCWNHQWKMFPFALEPGLRWECWPGFCSLGDPSLGALLHKSTCFRAFCRSFEVVKIGIAVTMLELPLAPDIFLLLHGSIVQKHRETPQIQVTIPSVWKKGKNTPKVSPFCRCLGSKNPSKCAIRTHLLLHRPCLCMGKQRGQQNCLYVVFQKTLLLVLVVLPVVVLVVVAVSASVAVVVIVAKLLPMPFGLSELYRKCQKII